MTPEDVKMHSRYKGCQGVTHLKTHLLCVMVSCTSKSSLWPCSHVWLVDKPCTSRSLQSPFGTLEHFGTVLSTAWDHQLAHCNPFHGDLRNPYIIDIQAFGSSALSRTSTPAVAGRWLRGFPGFIGRCSLHSHRRHRLRSHGAGCLGTLEKSRDGDGRRSWVLLEYFGKVLGFIIKRHWEYWEIYHIILWMIMHDNM